MIRHLLPRFEYGRWAGAALTRRGDGPDDMRGWCLCVQWLGLMIEIGVGGVRR